MAERGKAAHTAFTSVVAFEPGTCYKECGQFKKTLRSLVMYPSLALSAPASPLPLFARRDPYEESCAEGGA